VGADISEMERFLREMQFGNPFSVGENVGDRFNQFQ
jgi:hypothetical protein